MNRRVFLFAFVLLVLAGGAYTERGVIRDWIDARNAPTLPPAQPFTEEKKTDQAIPGALDSAFEPGSSTSEHYQLETRPAPKPAVKDPLVYTGALPRELNLDVPFTTQAPLVNWDALHEETCEEAALLMVDAFYRGRTGRIPGDEAERQLQQIVADEKQRFGHFEDTDATEVTALAKEYFGYRDVRVLPLSSIDDVKKIVALGYPVLVPTAGKLLHNPNFHNGGPLFHMLVVRGYTPDFVITNDPGTRKGMGYTYTYDTLMNAAHDWNKGDVLQGARVMIVVLPDRRAGSEPAMQPTPSPSSSQALRIFRSEDGVTTVAASSSAFVNDDLSLTAVRVLTGTSTAFENQISWSLTDALGAVLKQGSIYVHSPDAGIPGPFTFDIAPFATTSTRGTLRIFEASAKDGTPLHVVEIPVTFGLK